MPGSGRRSSWGRCGFVVAVVCVGLVGAGGVPPSANAAVNGAEAEAIARALGHEVEEIAPRRLAGLHPQEITDLRSSAEQVVRDAPPPPQLSAEQQAAVHELVVAAKFDSVLGELDQQRDTLSSDGADVAAATTSDPRAQSSLADSATEILHDAACGTAFNVMTPQERTDADAAGESKAFDDALVDPASGAVLEFAERALATAVGGPEAGVAIEWEQYTGGLAEKAQRFENTLNGAGLLELPHNQGVNVPPQFMTRAYAYYARECLQPPG